MPDWTEKQIDQVAARMVAGGLAPWLHVTTKEQQAQALAEMARTDAFNFGVPDGVYHSTRLAAGIARKLGIGETEIEAV